MRSLLKRLFQTFGLAVLKTESLNQYASIVEHYERNFRSGQDTFFLSAMPDHHIKQLLLLSPESKSQIRQDLFVLSTLNFKRNGYFVEFGATNGKDLSNTWLLEKSFNWNGILAEPAKIWQEELRKNRTARIDQRGVWKRDGEILEFLEATHPELSQLRSDKGNDFHSKDRVSRKTYSIESVSLGKLLQDYQAPKIVDYLSIDTEGSEYEILRKFNFDSYQFNCITVEHNFSNQRKKIFKLLSNVGYNRVHSDVSNFDDWYIHKSQTLKTHRKQHQGKQN